MATRHGGNDSAKRIEAFPWYCETPADSIGDIMKIAELPHARYSREGREP